MSITLALAGVSAISSIFSSSSQKKSAEEAAEKQRLLAEMEYNYNLNELNESTEYNLVANFSKISSDMYSLTQEYTNNKSNLNLNKAVSSGTIAYSSTTQDLNNRLESDFLSNLEIQNFQRDEIEKTLIDNYNSSKYQLQLNKYNAEVGISTQLQNATTSANSSLFNSLANTFVGLGNKATEVGGWGNLK